MFELERIKVKISDVDPRAEKHGPEHELACDIHFQIIGSNDLLSLFSGWLKSAMYHKSDNVDQPELLDEPSHLPNLKFPEMGPFSWNYKGEGYTTVLHLGLDDKSDMTIYDCSLNKIKITCKEGGSVQIDFKVAFYPGKGEIERLCLKIQESVDITLTPPEADEEFEAA